MAADPISSSPSSTDNGPTVVVVVFISLGCVFFLGVCLFAFWFLIKRWKKKSVQETDIIRCDEHLKVKEDIVKGPFGPQAVILSIEEDKHFEEETSKKEKQVEEELMHARTGGISATDHVEGGESSSNPGVHHTYHHAEYKS
ncbi:protein TRACHEARY ELEMENT DIFFERENTIATION-RELATED 6 [Sesamum alatum]|uniref:Protein TRACHEARY ELEMENT DIFFERENTIATION-RELATED 6 n=1 Tax=Sesamum alatum TaxID=300844 RepID=A0AAE1YPX2_9LAMI|nr:protein TRACHEARY ELEMENT DIFFERENTIATION-RELATED 6 [Sesamum alatum]